MNELSLVKLYMQLTGSTEGTARSVLMHVMPTEGGPVELPNRRPVEADPGLLLEVKTPIRTPGMRRVRRVREAVGILLLGFIQWAGGAPAEPSPSLMTSPMSLADAVNIAWRQHPNILRAQKELAAAQGWWPRPGRRRGPEPDWTC